jgi:UDP-glucose:(heptosyl)LPS alpha-1,3-glucosyltransferase
MRIAITHTRYTRIGGVEGYVRDLSKRLLDAGHELHCFCQEWDEDADPRIRFHEVPRHWKWVRWLDVRAYDRAVERLVRPSEWDVVHGFSASSRQDVYTPGPLVRESPARLKLHERELAAIERRRFTRGSFKKIVVRSRASAARIESAYGLSSPDVEVVPNGVDAARFHPGLRADPGKAFRERLGIAPDEFVFLLVGNDYRRKGVETAIEAVTHLAHDLGFTRKFRLLVVGEETHAREQELIARAHERDVGDLVKFHGPTPLIERFYAVADALVLPARALVFGQVVLEAMACGVPPIVTATAGASEHVKHGESGFVVEDPRDARAFAKHMRDLATDEALRERMGERARAEAQARSWERHLARILEIYEEVALSKRPKGLAAASVAPS